VTAPLASAGLLEANGTLIAEIIAFIVMVLILARWVYPFIIRVAEERERKIEEGIRASEEAQRQLASVQEQVAKTLNEAREQARDVVSRSHHDAVVEAEDVRKQARADAEALVLRAQTEIGAERDRAIQELRSEVSSLVVEAASRVIGESLDERAHRRLIDEALEKVADRSSSARSN
jgi:F-type H+-transporting ATPase subunit b